MTDAYRIAKRIIKERGLEADFTVVTSQDPFETGLVGSWIKKAYAFPFQIQIHTDFLSPFFATSILQNVRVRIAQRTIPCADGIRTVSHVIAASIARSFPRLSVPVDILPIYVDIEGIIHAVPARNVREDFPEFDHIVLMASRLTSEKRIDVAIRAFRKILDESPRVGLVVCGSGPLQGKLEALTRKLNVSSNVRFVGWQNDLISYFKSSDLFVLTSQYEGYGMTLMEAGAAGCPIVTAKVGIAKTDLFVHGVNCSICEPCDETTVSQAILEMLASPVRRSQYAANMQESIKDIALSWDAYVLAYIQLLDKLL